MEDKKNKVIKCGMLGINVAAVLGIAFFVCFTTARICDFFTARDFIGGVDAIPQNPTHTLIQVGFLALCLIVSFFLREFFYPACDRIVKGTLVSDVVCCVLLMYLLDYNYNGLVLYVSANVISHVRRRRGQLLFMLFAIAGFVGTDFQLLSIRIRLFSMSDYIEYYMGNVQQFYLVLYNMIITVNIVIFILFCLEVIQTQRGTIEEVRDLYQRLQQTNEELSEANIKLKSYAVMKEKMGETKERNRLAREIHDTLGHTLTGIVAGLDACMTILDTSPERTRHQLELISQVARDGIREIRRSVNELRPDALSRFGLEESIQKMINDMTSMSDVRVHYQNSGILLKFDEDEENAVYRTIQESMTNAIRHGQAREIWIEMEKKDGELNLEIRDNGRGCENMEPGFGTKHIRERIEMLGGNVEFNGNGGFTVRARIPIRWGEEYD